MRQYSCNTKCTEMRSGFYLILDPVPLVPLSLSEESLHSPVHAFLSFDTLYNFDSIIFVNACLKEQNERNVYFHYDYISHVL